MADLPTNFNQRGERGPTGDHGQDGSIGRKGNDGAQGLKGDQGVPGRPALQRLIFFFIFVVIIFVFLASIVERNSRRIASNQRTQQYERCVGGTKIIKQFDEFLVEIAAVEKRGTNPKSPTYDKAATPTRLERVRIYKRAWVPIPDCSKLRKE